MPVENRSELLEIVFSWCDDRLRWQQARWRGRRCIDRFLQATSPGITTTSTPRLSVASRIAVSSMRGIWLALEISSR